MVHVYPLEKNSAEVWSVERQQRTDPPDTMARSESHSGLFAPACYRVIAAFATPTLDILIFPFLLQ